MAQSVDQTNDGSGGTDLFLSTAFSTPTTANTTVMFQGVDHNAVAFSDSSTIEQDEVFLVEVTNAANGAFRVLGETEAIQFSSKLGQFSLTVILSGATSHSFGTANGDLEFISGADANLIANGNIVNFVVTVARPGRTDGRDRRHRSDRPDRHRCRGWHRPHGLYRGHRHHKSHRKCWTSGSRRLAGTTLVRASPSTVPPEISPDK
jgi:hypothetical protein